jgi:hypothetical protein
VLLGLHHLGGLSQANEENFASTSLLWHFGQTALSSRSSQCAVISKVVPHFLQAYSYTGMASSFVSGVSLS